VDAAILYKMLLTSAKERRHLFFQRNDANELKRHETHEEVTPPTTVLSRPNFNTSG